MLNQLIKAASKKQNDAYFKTSFICFSDTYFRT